MIGEPVMKVTTPEGEIYWMDGHDEEEAEQSFGVDATVEKFISTRVYQGTWDDSLPIPRDIE